MRESFFYYDGCDTEKQKALYSLHSDLYRSAVGAARKNRRERDYAMNTSKKTQLALVYIRYSSHAQDNGNSPAAQMTCAENYTEAHQMTIEQIYHDYAKTGRNTGN